MSTAQPTVASTTFLDRGPRRRRAVAALAPVNLPRGARSFGRVWTDTRTIEPGDLFVALDRRAVRRARLPDGCRRKGRGGSGRRRDAAAAKRLGVPVFEVRDTLVALGALGDLPPAGVERPGGRRRRHERQDEHEGADSTRRSAACSRFTRRRGNLNNLIGVPLTLLAIPDAADVAVVEMGTNQPGEVAAPSRDRRAEHHGGDVGRRGASRGIGRPRGRAARGDGGDRRRGGRDRAGVAAGSRRRGAGARRARRRGRPRRGRPSRHVRGRSTPDGRGHAHGATAVDVDVPLRGVHNLRNAMLALAVARELGVSLADAARGIAAMARAADARELGAARVARR